MALGPIPWTAIDRYSQRHGFEGEGFEYLRLMVRALDDVFLAHSRKKTKDAEGNPDGRPDRVREAD